MSCENQKGEQLDTETCKRFRVRKAEKYRAFPLDWTAAEWCHERGLNRGTVKAYLTGNKRFEAFFRSLRYYEGGENAEWMEEECNSIPAELEPFFLEYVQEAAAYGIKNKLQAKNLKKGKILEDFDKSFFKRCLTAAYQHPGDYLTGRMYENETVCKAAMEPYWDMLNKRIHCLETMVREHGASVQIKEVKEILSYVNLQIAKISAMKSDAIVPEETDAEPFVTRFPKEVIRHARQPEPAPDMKKNEISEMVAYQIPNVPVTLPWNGQQTTLEDIIKERGEEIIRHKIQAIKAGRAAYCTYLQNTAEGEFQRECRQLDAYLHSLKRPQDDAVLEAKIHAIGIRFFNEIVRGKMEPYDPAPEMRKESQEACILYDIIQVLCNRISQRYPIRLQLLKEYNPDVEMLSPVIIQMRWVKLKNGLQKMFEEDEILLRGLKTLRGWLETIWPESYLGTMETFQEGVLHEDMEKLVEKCYDAVMNVRTQFVTGGLFWMKNKWIRTMLNTYRNALQGKWTMESIENNCQVILYFFRLVITLRIGEEFREVSKEAKAYYLTLCDQLQK